MVINLLFLSRSSGVIWMPDQSLQRRPPYVMSFPMLRNSPSKLLPSVSWKHLMWATLVSNPGENTRTCLVEEDGDEADVDEKVDDDTWAAFLRVPMCCTSS